MVIAVPKSIDPNVGEIEVKVGAGASAFAAVITPGVKERRLANTASAVERINNDRRKVTKLETLFALRIKISPLISLQVMKLYDLSVSDGNK
jgi:streptogramin lyase